MTTYEQFIGPIHPGYVKPPSLEMLKSDRDIHRLLELDDLWARLSISHPSIDPDAITEALQLQPDDVMRAGDTIHQDKRFHVKCDRTRWNLSSGDIVSSPFPEAHLDWLLDQLYGKLPAIRSLQDQGAEFVINIHMEPWSRVVAQTLSVTTLQQLAQLRLELRFIIHYQNSESDY